MDSKEVQQERTAQVFSSKHVLGPLFKGKYNVAAVVWSHHSPVPQLSSWADCFSEQRDKSPLLLSLRGQLRKEHLYYTTVHVLVRLMQKKKLRLTSKIPPDF